MLWSKVDDAAGNPMVEVMCAQWITTDIVWIGVLSAVGGFLFGLAVARAVYVVSVLMGSK